MHFTSYPKLQIYVLLVIAALCLLISPPARAQNPPTRIAVIQPGDSVTAKRVAQQIAEIFKFESGKTEFLTIDPDQTKAAANGAGYRGSLNLTIEDARSLGAAIGCDFFFTGNADTFRRSPSDAPIYYEAFASLFLVSARTGKLVLWERQEFRRPTATAAEQALITSLSAATSRERYQSTIRRIAREEQEARAAAIVANAPVIELMPEDETTSGVRSPRPFRRLKPPYPDAAAHDRIEAVVDVLVDIDAKGKVGHLEITRWAGYGLDESVINTVKQLDFFPAMRDGVAIPMRVLLRYNFRKPPPE